MALDNGQTNLNITKIEQEHKTSELFKGNETKRVKNQDVIFSENDEAGQQRDV